MNIFDFSKELIQAVIESFAATQENRSVIVRQHASIFKAIKDKDADRARENKKQHLDWTNQKLIEHFR